MVLVGTGGVEHSELVKLAEKHFSSLPVSPSPIPLGKLAFPKTTFVGSEVRVRDDTLPTANIAIAVEGVSWSSPDYFPMMVMQSIFGNWDRSLGASSLTSSRLSHIVSSHNLANSYMSFSTSYSDTGLWGIYLVTENLMNIDDLVHHTLKEWTRMSIAPSATEVERAKSQLKAGLLLGLDGTTAVAEDIGRQLVTSGRRHTPQQIEAAIDAVGVEDIKRVAQKYLWDKDVSRFLTLISGHNANDLPFSSLLPVSVLSTVSSTTTGFVPTCPPCSTRRASLSSFSNNSYILSLDTAKISFLINRTIWRSMCEWANIREGWRRFKLTGLRPARVKSDGVCAVRCSIVLWVVNS
jgi:hypothetical protein